MPELKLNNTLTLDVVHSVEQKLNEFSVEQKVNFKDVDADLRCYFETYGFDSLKLESDYFLGFLNLKDYRVATHYWRVSQASATVFVAHGLFDHVGLYLDLVEFLLQQNFDVIAIDFPGHGLSEGEPAVIHDFSEYGMVIEQTLSALKDSITTPIFAVGQSTGCAAILNYVLVARGKEFEKLVLLAPLIQPMSWRYINIAHIALSKFIRFVRRSFTTNSHRAGFNEFLAHHDPLQSRRISVQWIGAMKKWINTFDMYDGSDVETLILQGDADETVDWQKNLPRIQKKFERCNTHIINGAMHHLVQEGDAWREPVFTRLADFYQPK